MKKELYSVYAKEDDITFVMEDTINENGKITAVECVGFYYGEPTEEDTRFFKGKLKADFEWAL
jgi:hypothetical protein